MGIRDKEKSRQDVKSNVGAIVGKEEKSKLSNIANADLTQKAYYITKSQYRKLRILSVHREVDMSYLIREMLDKYLNEQEG
jgi:predicted DNA-binding protein